MMVKCSCVYVNWSQPIIVKGDHCWYEPSSAKHDCGTGSGYIVPGISGPQCNSGDEHEFLLVDLSLRCLVRCSAVSLGSDRINVPRVHSPSSEYYNANVFNRRLFRKSGPDRGHSIVPRQRSLGARRNVVAARAARLRRDGCSTERADSICRAVDWCRIPLCPHSAEEV